MGLKLFTRKAKTRKSPRGAAGSAAGPAASLHGRLYHDYQSAPREEWNDEPLARMYQQGRLGTILRDEIKWRDQPSGAAVGEKAASELEQRMAFVPAGNVAVAQSLTDHANALEEETDVAPFLVDVHAVTNERFQRFVDAEGYDELEFWPEDIWPHLIEFKDLTGEPAPRFWREGRHDHRLGDHPVVGVSWFEAQAYALWIGQRLLTDAEWQMSASWHIKSSADIFRRFPWGDAMDNTRCNIWSARHGHTVPVAEYDNGAAPNRVMQLIGNVWEWTETEYTVIDEAGRPIVGEMPMHAVRGGAFDTYFEAQTTSQFRTGQIAFARAHNTGFRCAMDIDAATWMSSD